MGRIEIGEVKKITDHRKMMVTVHLVPDHQYPQKLSMCSAHTMVTCETNIIRGGLTLKVMSVLEKDWQSVQKSRRSRENCVKNETKNLNTILHIPIIP